MRHRVYGRKLGRSSNERTALFRGLVRSLILHGSIITTEAKAKAIKGLVDRLISKGKQGSNASLRVIQSIIPQEEVSQKIIKEISPRYPHRTSGFTQLVKLGVRKGDGAMLVKMNLVEGGKEEKAKGKAKEDVEIKEEVKEEKPKSKRKAAKKA